MSKATPLSGGQDYNQINMTVLVQKPDDTLCFPVKTSSGKIAMICL